MPRGAGSGIRACVGTPGYPSKILVGQEGAMQGGWKYFAGDNEIGAERWHEILEERREVMRSGVVN